MRYELTRKQALYFNVDDEQPSGVMLEVGTRVAILRKSWCYAKVWTEDGSIRGFIPPDSVRSIESASPK